MQEFLEFAAQTWYLFVVLLFILGWLIGGEVMQRVRGIPTVNPTQALQLINHQDAVVLDIRDGGEYKAGHIPEARHIPAASLESRLNELGKFKDKPLIVYCRTGVNASKACAVLKKNGFAAVHNLSGGIAAWQGANLPVSKKK